jgi:UPF0271 protein
MVTLNIDVGELPDEPEGLVDAADLLNVACGGHAGDETTIRAVLARAGSRGVGAHPSYVDREGFGRTRQELPIDRLAAQLVEQYGRLKRIAVEMGMHVGHVKPHGALYHAAAADPALADAVVGAAVDVLGPVVVLGPPEGELRRAAERRGLAYLREGFADRGLLPDGRLVPRGEPGALLTDPARAAAQARELARSGHFDTLCVHGDGPTALAVARAVRAALDAEE